MAKRRRRIRRLKIDEVSWVDRPANLSPFLFVKNESKDIDKKDVNLTVDFNTKGTPESTSLNVNGKSITDPQSFSLYYSPYGDSISLGCQYTMSTKGETRGGFSSTRTYSLSKNAEEIINEDTDEVSQIPDNNLEDTKKLANPDDLEIINSLVKVIDPDPEISELLAKQVSIIKLYKDDMPTELLDAIKSIIKLATETVEDSCQKEETEVTENVTQELNTDKLVEQIAESIIPKVTEQVTIAVKEQLEAQETARQEADQKAQLEADTIEVDDEQLAQEAMQEALTELNKP